MAHLPRAHWPPAALTGGHTATAPGLAPKPHFGTTALEPLCYICSLLCSGTAFHWTAPPSASTTSVRATPKGSAIISFSQISLYSVRLSLYSVRSLSLLLFLPSTHKAIPGRLMALHSRLDSLKVCMPVCGGTMKEYSDSWFINTQVKVYKYSNRLLSAVFISSSLTQHPPSRLPSSGFAFYSYLQSRS